MQRMQKFDSFLRESARMNPLGMSESLKHSLIHAFVAQLIILPHLLPLLEYSNNAQNSNRRLYILERNSGQERRNSRLSYGCRTSKPSGIRKSFRVPSLAVLRWRRRKDYSSIYHDQRWLSWFRIRSTCLVSLNIYPKTHDILHLLTPPSVPEGSSSHRSWKRSYLTSYFTTTSAQKSRA